MLWIDYGDSNTAYFHAQWKIRSSLNSITSIYTEAGMKLIDPNQVEQEFIFVFVGLMGDCTKSLPCLNTEIVRTGTCLTIQQQRKLIQEVTKEEILALIKAMPKNKSPGVDGFPIEFFTKNWDLVGKDILLTVKQFFQTNKLWPGINMTAITLIAKVPSPTKVKTIDLLHAAPLYIKSYLRYSLTDSKR